ncbi:DUF5107 domain-containing protein [Streptomyces katsurahamanus]|uniref:DUF5107 domain-containing protein n=1 Tax=Streptomyces katsurahamanus TaxID=2577098 RepID=A0ABW9NNF6_9ACTN|nr:DUF5107 domain-containing protein [Streptomyces katsurahamanus]MQS34823.1 DUF5107 domain-containing protein [Streptomyces katsurahamanus]
MATTVRRTVLTLPAAPVGPANPLPALRPLTAVHSVDERTKRELPREMARQIGYEPLRTLLPVRVLDGYGRERTPTAVDAVVIENDRLRVTVLPGLGGRIHSLRHKPTGRELLYRNPVLQPAGFALNGAWYSGGIEWNIGATGHSTLAMAPLHTAVVPAPDGGEMVRLWEWERLRDLPYQIDLWLPADSSFLHVGVRIRNPHERPVPVYWWSNTAVEEHPGTRVIAPADEAWHYGYERTLTRVPVPDYRGEDRTYPLGSEYPADYFYEIPAESRKWIAALGADGHGLVQTSTDALRGRKLFLWGSGRGGRRWQRWLTEPDTIGYAEIQAGLARTQLEHIRLEEGGELSWLECYGPLAADPGTAHGANWPAVCAEVESRLAAVLPRRAVDDAYAAWRPCADSEPVRMLATGSGWGALEVLRGRYTLPGTPFDASALGEEQAPWQALLATGVYPAPRKVTPPGPTLVSPHWRDMLETAPAEPLTEYHLGVAQWHAGDLAQAVRSWERGLELAPSRWPLLRALAVADTEGGHGERAADRYLAAFDDLCQERRDDGESWTAATAALGREAIGALLAAGRTAEARTVWSRLRPAVQRRGRFQLIHARLLLAEGRRDEARAVFDAGFEAADLREGGQELTELWARLTDEPLPEAYDFRIRPPEPSAGAREPRR